MKLSQSAHFVERKGSPGRTKTDTKNKMNKKQELYLQPITILIKINKNDELQPAFVDTFSKIILNNNNFDFQQCYGNIKTTTYSEFYETLRNLGNQMNRAKPCKDFNNNFLTLKGQDKMGFKKTKSYQNVRKGSIEIKPKMEKKNYVFCFQAYKNSITLLIDLSPYMLLYDYSTKSFLLQNAEQITRDLFIQLERHYNERKNGNSGPSYVISCYVFSVYSDEIEQVIREEEIFFTDSFQKKFQNKNLISDYICAYLNKSKLPHNQKKDAKPISISHFIQRILNIQQGNSGIKTIVIISAFKELDYHPYIFFNSNWYTFCFICAGELNFGSFLIDVGEIVDRCSKSPYLETKFVYKCRFLENWEKVYLIERQGCQFKYIDSSLQKSRAILYISSHGQKKQSIFEDILKFNLKLNEKKRRGEGTYRSNDSVQGVTKNSRVIGEYEFNIPAENIAEIMRTKYLQGWQQLSTQKYPQNTKYLFKLEFANRAGILYNATRTQDHFLVRVSSMLVQNQLSCPQQKIYKERKEIASKIKKIDLINTSNFDIVTTFKNTTQSDNKLKKSANYQFYLSFDEQGYEGMKMLNQILTDHQDWNCYFKVRRIYVHFTPNSHFLNDFNELLNEVGFFLGERISNLCFMQRKQKKEKLIDNIKEREVSRWNIIFCKVSGIFRFLEFKFGFLKYNDNEIKQAIQNIESKLISKKLSNGSIKIIPQDIYNYCIQKFDQPKLSKKSLPSIFQKTWRITFKNEYLCKVFKYMNNKIIKKLGYQLLKSRQSTYHYYNILTFGDKENKRDKGLFLQISYEGANLIQFKLEAFPSFGIVPSLTNKDSLIDSPTSQKNLYHLTQRSISSSSNQHSISSTSLPLPTNNSNKDVLQPKSNQNQGKYKNSFLQLFQILASELKQSQKRAINMVKCYTEIYDALIKKKLEEKKTGIEDEQFIWKVKEFYRFSSQDFETQFLTNLMQIKKQHYTEYIQQNPKTTSNRRVTIKIQQNIIVNQLFQINIDEIPEPTEYLMQSPITTIKGDLTLTSKTHADKKYIFFLMTPNRAIYLWKKQFSSKIYFRCLNNIYCSSSLIQKEEAELKRFVEKQLINRINKQLRQEQYLFFYNVIAEEQRDIATSLIQAKNKKQNKIKDHNALSMLRKCEKVVSSFTGVNLNCSQIFAIINKQENSIVQQRMIKVLIQFRKKFYEYISLFFENAKFNLQTEEYSIAAYQLSQDIKRDFKNSPSEDRKKEEGPQKKQQHEDFLNVPYFNNYFYEKKGVFFSEKIYEKYRIKNISDYGTLQNMVIKICTNTGLPIYEQNFVSLFINKARKKSGVAEPVKENKLPAKTEIHINFFGFKADKMSAKVRWLKQIMNELLTECVTYLNIVTVIQLNDIKQMENKLSEFIVRGPCEKVPDDLWHESEIARQIQSGHMRNLIPFCQYSFKPFPPKFISRQIQISPIFFNASTKSNNLIYLKYWLTIEITPARVLKTKLIPFQHINLLTEAILDLDQVDYEARMNKIVEDYLAQLLKFLRVRDIFKGIEHKLMFPLEPPILLYINNQIYKKLEDEKRKSMKIKVPKKFKNRATNYPALELKSLNSFMYNDHSTTLSFLQQGTPLNTGSLPSPLRLSHQAFSEEPQPNLKNYFKLSLIYQASINYFPKFESSQIFSLLACCEKLNPYAIRNLENTYIFFNPELREYFIFYLEESPTNPVNPNLQVPQTTISSAFSSTGGQTQKKRNNSLVYSVYCIDNTVPIDVIQKLHGGLIKKALEEVTFYKIAKILHVSHSIIDEAEEQYFKQGSKEELIFQIPHIQKKSNLNQYIKQHLERAFYHKKTQFKSELRKKQIDVDGQMGNRDESKISVRKKVKKDLTHSEQCDMRCVPQTWIFNTIQTRYLEQTFGKCMFLTRVLIYDYMDTCENAMFWQRHVKQRDQKNHEKHYIYPFMSGKSQTQEQNTYNQKLLLNYLQSFKEKQVIQRSKSIQISLKDKDSPELKENGDQQGQKNWHINPHQVQNYTIVKFQIFSSFGFPRISLIKNMYKQLLYFGIYDFYLENRIFRDLVINFGLRSFPSKNRKKSHGQTKQKTDIMQPPKIGLEKQEQQFHQISNLPLQRALSSPMKQSIGKPGQSFIVLCNDEFVNRIYLSFIDIFHTMQQQIPIKSTPCIFLYKTEKKVLIQEKTPSLLSFIKLFADDFYKNSKNDERYALRLIVYGIHKQTSETYFWGIEVERNNYTQKKCKFSTLFDQISNQIERQGHQFSKMGVFFCDSLHDIDSLRESFFLKDYQISKNQQNKEWQTFNRTDKLNIEFDWMKKFEEGRSFCQNQFLFKRSLLMHYQISDFEFICYTYNFREKQNIRFMQHLEEMEFWFSEKYRLYTFISRLKKLQSEEEPIQYEIPPYQTQKEGSSVKKIYSLERKITHRDSMPNRSTETYEPQINLTKLIKSLAFDHIPFKNFMKSRNAIQKMYKILSTHTVPYNNYPEYKGKQKSKLAKIAKEYLSIIRHYFGIEKLGRKDSVYAQDLKDLEKKKNS